MESVRRLSSRRRARDRDAVLNEAFEAVSAGRDLINTPASDLGLAELEAAVRDVGSFTARPLRASSAMASC